MSHEFDHVEPSLDHRKHEFGIAISIYHHSVDVSENFPMFSKDKVGSLLIPWLTWYQKHPVANFFHWDDESKEISHHETCVCFTISYPSNDWLLMLGSQGLGWTKQNNFVPACSRFGVVTFSTQFKGCLMASVSSPPIWTVVCGTRFQPQNFSWLVNLYPPYRPPQERRL